MVPLYSMLWSGVVEEEESNVKVVGHSPSSKASAVALLLHDGLLRWTLLILHLINPVTLASSTRLNARPSMLGAKSRKAMW